VASSKEMVRRLRKGGYKVTPQRLAVLKAIPAAASTSRLRRCTKDCAEYPHIGLVTVYRTLNILSELGWSARCAPEKTPELCG